MDDLTRAGFFAHRHGAAFKTALSRTLSLIAEHLDDRSYVSFSAGKDSAVCAHICHRRRPGIPILMVDPGCPHHWTEDERRAWIAWADTRGWNLRLFLYDKWTAAVSRAENDGAHRHIVHRAMFADLHAYAAAHGLDQRVMGMRAEESPARSMVAAVRGPAYTYADGGRALNPIMHWRVADVWAYTLRAGLPWLSIYDHLGPAARNGLIGRSGIKRGRLAWLKIHYPDAYIEARRVMPETAQYA